MGNNSVASAIGRGYGTGLDGAIIVTGSVSVRDIYENDTVSGVITWRGTDKGLNKGANTYSVINDTVINATTFTVRPGATLSAPTYWTNTSRNGFVRIKCTGTFVNNGTIDCYGKGFYGHAAHTSDKNIESEYGPIAGNGPGSGSSRPTTTYLNISTLTALNSLISAGNSFGSGGGGFHLYTASINSASGNEGGHGGGMFYVSCLAFFNYGTVNCNGLAGGAAGAQHNARVGAGSGGSGGLIIIQSFVIPAKGILSVDGGVGGVGSLTSPDGTTSSYPGGYGASGLTTGSFQDYKNYTGYSWDGGDGAPGIKAQLFNNSLIQL